MVPPDVLERHLATTCSRTFGAQCVDLTTHCDKPGLLRFHPFLSQPTTSRLSVTTSNATPAGAPRIASRPLSAPFDCSSGLSTSLATEGSLRCRFWATRLRTTSLVYQLIITALSPAAANVRSDCVVMAYRPKSSMTKIVVKSVVVRPRWIVYLGIVFFSRATLVRRSTYAP
jgi:hypothetical protein